MITPFNFGISELTTIFKNETVINVTLYCHAAMRAHEILIGAIVIYKTYIYIVFYGIVMLTFLTLY